MPRLTLVLERKPVHVYDVGSFVINIGRGDDMQVMIDHASVSRRQAQIRMENDATWSVRDLESATGTFLNGQRLTGAKPLKRGDEISFGQVSLFFDSAFTEPVTEAEANAKAGQATETLYMNMEDVKRFQQAVALKRRAQLQWEAKGEEGTFHLEGAAALVGRSPLCDLRVPAGPKHHILVIRGQTGFEVRNLSRWHRMRVRGWVAEQSRLTSGDTIEVRGLWLRFLDELTPRGSLRTRAAEAQDSPTA